MSGARFTKLLDKPDSFPNTIILRERRAKKLYRVLRNTKLNKKQPFLSCAMAYMYDEAIVANQLPYKKLNFPDGMPIEDQSDDDDGY